MFGRHKISRDVLCASSFRAELISFVRFTIFRDLKKYVSVLSSFNWEIWYSTKRRSIAWEHERIWPSTDKRARCDGIRLSTAECAMKYFLRNPIFTNTTEHCAPTRKNLTEHRQTRTLEFERAQPDADDCRKHWSRTCTYSHAEKGFERFFRSESFETIKIDFR